MGKRNLPRPTDAELAILRVLWDVGPGTVRQVHAVLSQDKPMGYTTVLKLMQIMTAKGLVERDDRRRTHVYRPKAAAETTQRQLVRDLLRRAFDGSASNMVMQALSAGDVSADELAQIRAAIDEIERRKA